MRVPEVPDHELDRLDDDHDDPPGEVPDAVEVERRVPLEDQFAQPELLLPDPLTPDAREEVDPPEDPDDPKPEDERGEDSELLPPLDQELREEGVIAGDELIREPDDHEPREEEDEPQLLERDVEDELRPDDHPPLLRPLLNPPPRLAATQSADANSKGRMSRVALMKFFIALISMATVTALSRRHRRAPY